MYSWIPLNSANLASGKAMKLKITLAKKGKVCSVNLKYLLISIACFTQNAEIARFLCLKASFFTVESLNVILK